MAVRNGNGKPLVARRAEGVLGGTTRRDEPGRDPAAAAYPRPSSLSKAASSMTGTPSFSALSSLLPASAPATT